MKKLNLVIFFVLLVTACSPKAPSENMIQTAIAETKISNEQTLEALPTKTLRPSSTPKPTNTLLPTLTPMPTKTKTLVPTSTPTPEPVVLTGTGDSVIDFINPFEMGVIHITGNASGRFFAVKAYTDDGQYDLLVNTGDPYDGFRPLDFGRKHTTRFEVMATGDWKIELLPITSAHLMVIPGEISGKGDDVILLLRGNFTPDLAKITGNASSRFFAVKSYGQSTDLLVNTGDPYEGTVVLSSDVIVLEVMASDSWTIKITTK